MNALSADELDLVMRTKLFDWLTHDKRLVEAALDDRCAHISKLLSFVNDEAKALKGPHASTVVSFCGPVAIAYFLAKAAQRALLRCFRFVEAS